MQYFKIDKYSHNFKITVLTSEFLSLVNTFANDYMQKGLVKVPRVGFLLKPIKIFGSATKDRIEFRFHINQLSSFRELVGIKNYNQHNYTITDHKLYKAHDIQCELKPEWQPRENQITAIDYLTNAEVLEAVAKNEPVKKFLGLATGAGKGFLACRAISEYKKRTVVVVKPKYVQKWVEDIEKHFAKIKKHDIIVVQGSDALKKTIALATGGELVAKFIIISSNTLQNYIKLYEEFRKDFIALGYDCTPDVLFETLGAGVRLIDEVHESFHLYFKIDCFTNIPISISMSATLLNLDNFLEKMYYIAYPLQMRFKETGIKKYNRVRTLFYNLNNPERVKTSYPGNNNYNHNAFEEWILKNKQVKDNYFSLILHSIETSYMKNYQKGDRLAVFCSSIAMCTAVTQFLVNKYPSLLIRRFVEDDPDENLLYSDISVTSIQSGGTGHDIKQLTTCIMTINVNSIQSNIQTIGRLREITNRETNFIYFICQDIPKHLEYHDIKKKFLQSRVFSHVDSYSPITI